MIQTQTNTKDQQSLERQRILIVDDSRTSRFLIRHLVEQLAPNSEVIEATDTNSALLHSKQHVIYKAIIDFHMPGGNGLDLALKLQEHYPKIKLAIISANAPIPLQAHHKILSVTQLGKPIQPAHLLQFLQQ